MNLRSRIGSRKARASLVFTLLPVLLWFGMLRPASLGGPAGYVMVRGVSMLPTYVGGDLIITHKARTYVKGDIVAYKVPKGEMGEGIVVIHRIIGGSPAKGYVIRGDNNPDNDDWHPKNKDIVGKSWLRLPKVGLVLGFLHSPIPLASLAAALVIVFILFPEDKKTADERKVKKAAEKDKKKKQPVRETEKQVFVQAKQACNVARPKVQNSPAMRAHRAAHEPKPEVKPEVVPVAKAQVEPKPARVTAPVLDIDFPAVHPNRFSRHLDSEQLDHGTLERIPVLAKLPCVIHDATPSTDLGMPAVAEREDAREHLAEVIPFPRVA